MKPRHLGRIVGALSKILTDAPNMHEATDTLYQAEIPLHSLVFWKFLS